MSLSPIQMQIIRESMQEYGELPLAAHQAGITVSVLRRELERDPALADEIDHYMALRGSALVVLAQQKAASSDTILKTLLEAKVPGFARETRERSKDSAKPTTLVLREFDDDGNDGITDVEPKKSTGPVLIGLAPLL